MFRLFLRKKILAGKDHEGDGPAAPSKTMAAAPRRNRRIFARYSVDHKHLTIMNDADIFLVREISAKGFSTEVSPRGYDRLVVGDVYEARIRYLGEIYDLQARVAWKSETFVGFELVEATAETLRFIKRLLRPIEIAGSLQPVDAAFMNDQNTGKSWYHGDEDSDLYVWHDAETSELRAWQLAIGDHYVEWNESSGLATGSLTPVPGREALMGANMHGLVHRPDSAPDPQKKQFAVDVIMALQHPVREELLDTFAATA